MASRADDGFFLGLIFGLNGLQSCFSLFFFYINSRYRNNDVYILIRIIVVLAIVVFFSYSDRFRYRYCLCRKHSIRVKPGFHYPS